MSILTLLFYVSLHRMTRALIEKSRFQSCFQMQIRSMAKHKVFLGTIAEFQFDWRHWDLKYRHYDDENRAVRCPSQVHWLHCHRLDCYCSFQFQSHHHCHLFSQIAGYLQCSSPLPRLRLGVSATASDGIGNRISDGTLVGTTLVLGSPG